MTVGTETRAYLQKLEAYDAAAERNGTDHTHPPKPLIADVAFDVSAICAKSTRAKEELGGCLTPHCRADWLSQELATACAASAPGTRRYFDRDVMLGLYPAPQKPEEPEEENQDG